MHEILKWNVWKLPAVFVLLQVLLLAISANFRLHGTLGSRGFSLSESWGRNHGPQLSESEKPLEPRVAPRLLHCTIERFTKQRSSREAKNPLQFRAVALEAKINTPGKFHTFYSNIRCIFRGINIPTLSHSPESPLRGLPVVLWLTIRLSCRRLPIVFKVHVNKRYR